ncbi:MAG: aspartate--tRNA(Asn) ligase [Candidatus Thermoplasmatota archaeon]|jgi:aspartyl-tRNA synthetase|nr:aspartate--tRNA(Asn) ligase [Candidatus Thermoplasmatota archaeon]
MEYSYISDLRSGKSSGTVKVRGWVQDIRRLKNVDFIILRDHTGTAQVTVKKSSGSLGVDPGAINRESVIEVEGENVQNSISKTGTEILANRINVINTSMAPLPLPVTDPVEADIETRLNNRFLDLRKPHIHHIFEAESELMWGIRKFLHGEKFVEVHTPKVVAAATEGGADLFGVKYFEMEAYLNQSPQLYKEILISSGFNRVFEVGPAFRAEKHNTVRHLNEFTSVDIEMAFSDHNDAMSMLERAVKSGIGSMKSAMDDRVELISKIETPSLPFPRITYRKCIDVLHDSNEDLEFGLDFTPEQLKIIGDGFEGFYFITEWPSTVRPFYTMINQQDESITNSFDLQYKDKEITSGAQRVHDPVLLEKRFRNKGLNPKDFEFYLNAFRFGMPPHAGWGLGLERLTMILLDLKNIRETSLFPRDRTRLVP